MGEFHTGLQRCKPGSRVAVVLERQPGLPRAWPLCSQEGLQHPRTPRAPSGQPWPHPASCPSAGAGLVSEATTASPPPDPPPGRRPTPKAAEPRPGRWEAVCWVVTVAISLGVRSPAPVLIYNTASAPRRVFLKGIISINFTELLLFFAATRRISCG